MRESELEGCKQVHFYVLVYLFGQFCEAAACVQPSLSLLWELGGLQAPKVCS
jgi:hypothetical protein